MGDFNTSLSPKTKDRSSRQKLNRNGNELKDIINQRVLACIYKAFHPNIKEYVFSEAHGTFSKVDHIIRQKASLNRYKKRETIPVSYLTTMD